MRSAIIWIFLCFLVFAGLNASAAEDPKPLKGMDRTTKTVLLYLPNRFLDLADIFRLNVGVGPGWGINFRATEFMTGAASDYDTIRFGMRGREMPRYEESVNESCVGLFGLQLGKFDRDPFELAFTGHAAVAGLEAGVDLDEIVDFILGWACVDYRRDDLGSK